MSASEAQNLCNELNILQKVDHPNIAKYFENYEDSNFIYVCMELIDGGDLDESKLSEAKLAIIMKKILFALKHCHEQNIVHRDIKP